MSALACDLDTVEDLECWTCNDTGEYAPSASGPILPCPDCELGVWNDVLELADEARRGR